MTTNKTLLEKADLAISDLSGGGKGGLLQPEQAATFIRKLMKTPTMINGNVIRVVPMNSSQKLINKIGFGKRILRKGVSGVALNTAAIEGAFDPLAEATARAKPTTEQIALNTKEVIAELRIPYDVMEDNIERASAANNEASNTGPGGLRTTIIEMIAERAAIDLEELGVLGDKTLTATDPYLALCDGWLKLANVGGNVVDANGAVISRKLFKNGAKAMPDQYLRQLNNLTHFVSFDNEIEYRDQLADRPTNRGDAYLEGTDPIYATGSRVMGVSVMPASKGLFSNPKNFIMGVQRQVSLEFDKDISARTYIIVLTARVDFQIEEDDAVVEYVNIGEE